MKNNIATVIITIALITLTITTSCVSHKPYAKQVSDLDYNQRVEAIDPQYKKVRNAVGIAVDLGMPIVGGLIGISTGPLTIQSEQGRQKFTAGNAVMGVLLGTGISYLSDKIGGYGKMVTANDKQKWVKKSFGNDYILISYSHGLVRAINRNAERNYTVKNMLDVEDFAAAFPRSIHATSMLSQALKVVPRQDIPSVLYLYPESELATSFQQRYIKTSTSYNELHAASIKYPNAFNDSELENLHANAVQNLSDAISFHSLYPESLFNTDVVLKVLSSAILTDSELDNLRNVYGKQVLIDKERVLASNNQVKTNYYNLMFRIANPKTVTKVDEFNKSYAWLKFDDKRHVIVKQAWNLAYNSNKKGASIIAQAGKIVTKKYARDLGVTGEYFKGFVQQELQKEQSKIKILSINHLSSTSEQFERWKQSVYSASVVRIDELQFLVYGEIRNESRFDLPINITAGATAVEIMDYESGGLVGSVVKVLSLGMSPKRTLGYVRSTNFVIPLLEAGTTMPYAMLFKFKDSDVNGHAGGVNLANLVKASYNISLEDVRVQSVVWEGEMPDEEKLKSQNEWLKMAINGLPGAKVVDMFSSREFRQEEWDDKWDAILHEASQSSYSSSSNTSSNNNDSERHEGSSTNYYNDNERGEAGSSNSTDKRTFTCRVEIFLPDGSHPVLQNVECWIHGGWSGEGGYVRCWIDDSGRGTIEWDESRGDYVKDIINICEGTVFRHCYHIKNVELKPGGTYVLTASED